MYCENSAYGVKVEGASGIVLNNIIIEGGTCNYPVFFNYDGSTVVNDFVVDGAHIEMHDYTTAIHVDLKGGISHVNNLFIQHGGNIIHNTGRMKIENLVHLPGNSSFTGAGAFIFEECYPLWELKTMEQWEEIFPEGIPHQTYDRYGGITRGWGRSSTTGSEMKHDNIDIITSGAAVQMNTPQLDNDRIKDWGKGFSIEDNYEVRSEIKVRMPSKDGSSIVNGIIPIMGKK
jgi:hypothetical protein